MKKSILRKWPFLFLAILIGAASSTVEGFISIYMMRVVDTALAGDKMLFFNEAKILVLLAILLLPINLALSFAKGLYKYKTLSSLKFTFMDRVFKKNISEFQRDNNGLYISAMTNDMNIIENNYIEGIFQICMNVISFLVAVIVIYSVSPFALLLAIFITLFSTILTMFLSKPLQRHQVQRSKLFEGYTSYIKEVLGAFSIIKANNLSSKVKENFYNKSKDIQYKGYIIDKIYTFFLAIQNFTVNLSFFGIAGVVVFMAIKGRMTTGGVVLIINNMEKIIHPLMQVSEWLPKIFSVKSLFENMEKILKNNNQYEENIELTSFNEGIELKDVSFGYDDILILKNINLKFKKGGKYLIVGPSGGGKSTLLKLLRKYFLPSKGVITVDNLDLKDITKESYFNIIANVEQQIFLFEDTLRNNLTLYKDYSDEEINLAIQRAGLTQFVEELPNKLDTMIYDNGKNISGGEKSRIAIARSLLANKDIIFLDEAFASLDEKVAKEIEKTLLALENITVINVSHILFNDTKESYDRVISIAGGSVS
ncbi:ATP-binding cassette, subfamily C [Anaerobranca californiensis DSM 14826]|jgi:ATP-binding cassette subfamily C protein|uniref:ATP-binding cassette, subfamily C n=1 Tax=Anaerobranca californiensis DSM 14826 TaxID=1120989 RepID=A0A1M6N7M4_9FIRM|nr:ABC transporter ATP-binding protein [Anaerobranca californiensis]SHJ91693.1 ATP-binding cassette, subfamily C [Anaerobranca californiensis DSM 14826]